MNAGQFLGPLLCGPATNNVPQVNEMGCTPSSDDSDDCISGYPWTSSIAAFVMFCISLIFYLFVPSLQKTLDLVKQKFDRVKGIYDAKMKKDPITKKDYVLLVDSPDEAFSDEEDHQNKSQSKYNYAKQGKKNGDSSTPSGSPVFHTPSSSPSRTGLLDDVKMNDPCLNSSYYVTRTLSNCSPKEERVSRRDIDRRSNSYDMTLHQNHFNIPHTLNIPESLGTYGNFSKGKSSPFHYHYEGNTSLVQSQVQEIKPKQPIDIMRKEEDKLCKEKGV